LNYSLGINIWCTQKEEFVTRVEVFEMFSLNLQAFMNSAGEWVACISVTVLGWLHTSLQFLLVTLPVLVVLYDTLHPSYTPTSESPVGFRQESVGSVGSTAIFSAFHLTKLHLLISIIFIHACCSLLFWTFHLTLLNTSQSYIGPRLTVWFSCSAPMSEDVWHGFCCVCLPAVRTCPTLFLM